MIPQPAVSTTLATLSRAKIVGVLLALIAFLSLTFASSAEDRVLKTAANVVAEARFTATRVYADPFNEVTLDVVFRDPQGREFRVPAFWAGSNCWMVRYASPVIGMHHFQTTCSPADDPGLHGVTGRVEIKRYGGKNPLYRHGPIQVSASLRYFEHADGTPFFWLGDTWWMGLCHRLQWPDELRQLAADRKAKGFNVIQIVAGLYPDMPAFDPRGANEAGFPWETNYTSIRPDYFAAADRRLGYLVEQGFAPCIVGAWGYYLPWMGVEKVRQHWRFLIARYAAWPVLWCAAGEANLPWYEVKTFPSHALEQARDWTELMHFIRATDPFHRPMTIHPSGKGRASSRTVVATDPAALDFDMLQTPHGRREAIEETVDTVRRSYADLPVMPVIDGEAAYERLKTGNGALLETEWTRRTFWLCVLNGTAGHTYGANGIWECNRRDQPYGKSPLGSDYGPIAWDEAMKLPGSTQVALGKRLLEKYPWQVFEPHPEWVRFEVKTTEPSNEGVYAPQAAGIPDEIRIIYVPQPDAITVTGLGSRTAWSHSWFDPVTGSRSSARRLRPDENGSWTCPAPAGHDHDWILILEADQRGRRRF